MVRDQGVAGSNPVSPTQKAAIRLGKPTDRGLRRLLCVTRLQSFRSGGRSRTGRAALTWIHGRPANTASPRAASARNASPLGRLLRGQGKSAKAAASEMDAVRTTSGVVKALTRSNSPALTVAPCLQATAPARSPEPWWMRGSGCWHPSRGVTQRLQRGPDRSSRAIALTNRVPDPMPPAAPTPIPGIGICHRGSVSGAERHNST